jgi:hypothetical protein
LHEPDRRPLPDPPQQQAEDCVQDQNVANEHKGCMGKSDQGKSQQPAVESRHKVGGSFTCLLHLKAEPPAEHEREEQKELALEQGLDCELCSLICRVASWQHGFRRCQRQERQIDNADANQRDRPDPVHRDIPTARHGLHSLVEQLLNSY